MANQKRLTRRTFLKVAAAGTAGFLAACSGLSPVKAKDKIRVGMARPLSGWNAKIGDSAYRPVYETFIKEVNDAGGIMVKEYGKKLPIEPIIYDDKSDVGTMTMLTEKLIVEDKVDFLWPASGTSFLFAQAPIANKYGYVLVTAEGGAFAAGRDARHKPRDLPRRPVALQNGSGESGDPPTVFRRRPRRVAMAADAARPFLALPDGARSRGAGQDLPVSTCRRPGHPSRSDSSPRA